jgi:hypothetical protein
MKLRAVSIAVVIAFIAGCSPPLESQCKSFDDALLSVISDSTDLTSSDDYNKIAEAFEQQALIYKEKATRIKAVKINNDQLKSLQQSYTNYYTKYANLLEKEAEVTRDLGTAIKDNDQSLLSEITLATEESVKELEILSQEFLDLVKRHDNICNSTSES